MLNVNLKNKSGLSGAILLFLIIVGFGVYYSQQYAQKRKVLEKYRKTPQRISQLTEGNIDWVRAGQELTVLLEEYPNVASPREKGVVILKLADVTRLSDRKRSMESLKGVATDAVYPNATRAAAINLLVDALEELNFFGPNFEKQESIVFSSEQFSKILNDTGGDIDLAVKKLNEWSLELSPNAIAHYRLARWYAEELYKNPKHSQKKAYITLINEHITLGDALLATDNISKSSRKGLAYGLKARALHVAGRNSEAEESFKKSQEVLRTEPRTIFQLVHLAQTTLFYSAFLAKEYGQSRAEDIKHWLTPLYEYLKTVPEPDRRNISLVSLFIAARDSTENGYPFIDFDHSDVKRFYDFYPGAKEITESLHFMEYVKGHPLEAWVLR